MRGPEPISTRSLAIFVSETATPFSAAVELHQAVAVGLRLEAVTRRRAQPQALPHALGELGMGVEARAGGGATERDLAGAAERVADAVAAER